MWGGYLGRFCGAVLDSFRLTYLQFQKTLGIWAGRLQDGTVRSGTGGQDKPKLQG